MGSGPHWRGPGAPASVLAGCASVSHCPPLSVEEQLRNSSCAVVPFIRGVVAREPTLPLVMASFSSRLLRPLGRQLVAVPCVHSSTCDVGAAVKTFSFIVSNFLFFFN